MTRHERRTLRHGNAIVMVVLFLAIVGSVIAVLSSQGAFVRRTNARSHLGFQADEICASAINEAAGQVGMNDVFPPGTFNMQAFLKLICTEDKPGLDSTYPGYHFDFRALSGAGGGLIFVSMGWPDSTTPGKNGDTAFNNHFFTKDCPNTRAVGPSSHGFVSVSPVNVSVLAWRRDFAGIQWQDWGVLRYDVTTIFTDGKNQMKRRMSIDRMFSIYAHTMAVGNDCPPDPAEAAALAAGDFFSIFVHFIQSQRNIKTVVIRS